MRLLHNSTTRAFVALLVLRPSSSNAQPADPKLEAPPVAPALQQSERGSGPLTMKLGAIVQGDGRFFLNGEGIDTFVIRRARIDLRATLAEFLSVRLHPEFAGSSLTLLDAYGTIGFIEEMELQVGKMKSPLGLELLQSARDLSFAERGLPSLLVPNRDAGAVLQGDLLNETLSYAVGVFNGVPDGAHGESDSNEQKDFIGRLFVRPFKSLGIEALSGFGAGVGASVGEQAGTLPVYRTPGRQTFFAFSETSSAEGLRTRLAPQGYYYFGQLGVLGEYVRSMQRVSDGTQDTRVTSSAWQVSGSLVLGGKVGYEGTQVNAPLDPGAGTWGALEIAARCGELVIEEDAFDAGLVDVATSARAARNFGVGVSWWFLKGSRALFAYDYTGFDGGAPVGGRSSESVLITRLQVTL